MMLQQSRSQLGRIRCTPADSSIDASPSNPPVMADALSNLFGFHVDRLGTADAAYAGGAILSGCVVWCLAVVAHMIPRRRLPAIHEELEEEGPLAKKWMRVAWRHVVTCSGLPGSVMAPYALVVEPLVAASVALLAAPANIRTDAGAVVLGIFGLSLLLPLALLWWRVLRRRPFPLVSVKIPPEMILAVCPPIAGLCSPRWEWCAEDESRHEGSVLLQHYLAVFEGYRGERHWYFVVEFGISITTGILIGVGTGLSLDSSSCSPVVAGICLYGTLLLSVMLIVAAAVLRPFSTLSNAFLSVILSALGAISIALTIAGDDGTASVISFVQSALGFVVVPWWLLQWWPRIRTSGIVMDDVKEPKNEVVETRMCLAEQEQHVEFVVGGTTFDNNMKVRHHRKQCSATSVRLLLATDPTEWITTTQDEVLASLVHTICSGRTHSDAF